MLCWLALCALLAQALMPAGFMPARGAGGGFEIVICTSAGSATVTVGGDQSPQSGADGHEGGGNHCPYAPVLAQDTPAPAPTIAILAAAITMDFAPETAAPDAAAAKPWQAQGPPLS